MQSWIDVDGRVRGLVIRYAACWGLLLASVVLLPTLGWLALEYRLLPDPIGPTLFLWPQYLFLPNGVALEAAIDGPIYASGVAAYVAAAFWALAVGGYVWATRRLAAGYVYAGLLPAVFVVLAAVVYPVLALLGFAVVLDGP